jgi:hypothetical protein
MPLPRNERILRKNGLPTGNRAAEILRLAQSGEYTVPEISEITGATQALVRHYVYRWRAAGLRLTLPDGRVTNGRMLQQATCGTLASYTRGCRCTECRVAMRDYQRERREEIH